MIEKAIYLKPDLKNGRSVYAICAVCHEPEDWDTPDGDYPQIAEPLSTVAIKRLVRICPMRWSRSTVRAYAAPMAARQGSGRCTAHGQRPGQR